jgi:hypothetical protein
MTTQYSKEKVLGSLKNVYFPCVLSLLTYLKTIRQKTQGVKGVQTRLSDFSVGLIQKSSYSKHKTLAELSVSGAELEGFTLSYSGLALQNEFDKIQKLSNSTSPRLQFWSRTLETKMRDASKLDPETPSIGLPLEQGEKPFIFLRPQIVPTYQR